MALDFFDSTHLRSLEEMSAEQGPELSCEWPEKLKLGKIEGKVYRTGSRRSWRKDKAST